MVMRHGIEELPYPQLCARVFEMMENADENGHPQWDADTAAVANELLEYDDEILACHVLDVLSAVEAAKAKHLERRKAAT